MENFETQKEVVKLAFDNPHLLMVKISKQRNRIIELLSEAVKISTEELIARAHRIKPLIRLDEQGKPTVGNQTADSKLFFVRPANIRESFYYSFGGQNDLVCSDNGQPLPVNISCEKGRFICYHDCCGYRSILRPSVDEVLEQMPRQFQNEEIDAFEVCFSSLDSDEIFSYGIGRQVSTVILYRLAQGLPEEIKNQPVILGTKVC